MSAVFREFVKKIGSGRLTGRDLSREESCRAMRLLLDREPTPAQAGAFLIAHRIKRPTPEELAGILDAFDAVARPLSVAPGAPGPVILSSPYDGQDRLANITPLTALIVSSLGLGVVLHGSTDMPPKHGLTSFDLLAALGIDLFRDSQELSEQYKETAIGWVYLPAHFPEAFELQTYRDEIGKRPPLATAELFWNPVGLGLPVIGYTHRETITLAVATAQLRAQSALTLIRGVQGSMNCTLFHPNLGVRWRSDLAAPETFRLVAGDFDLADDDLALTGDGHDLERLRGLMMATLKGEDTPLRRAAIFNSTFLLAEAGFSPSLREAIPTASRAIDDGLAFAQLQKLMG
ncbi:anthranilate phosphoribosyltransferase [Gloeobacter kilaueensis]|uniref:Anthranilate phosphoribosyltransferase n=1 Tax=Gloeobacter kilaueensis (strain ATCC BAA-2537 / CCAP 1431/1 / ULC 316 / JS1) TaxID=1183438 RepID=U5QCG8_GLOK1|nr:anthranilate phosphoribosyltransferase [Gloeobacter kilaueensis]AGY56566.1 anthranilate phosphoribosyltransferase [Gloeobacter kilaueensis JS1]